MLDLKRIDLGNDEAEQDARLQEYFLRTSYYENALSGRKTLVIGRKGSGESAIFTLMGRVLSGFNTAVILITPDQYAWSTLKAYQEQGIMREQAHANAWRLTLLTSVVVRLDEDGMLPSDGRLRSLTKQLTASGSLTKKGWFTDLLRRLRDIKIWHFGLGLHPTDTPATPLRIINELSSALQEEWPEGYYVRILIDRLDDSWDASPESRDLMIGLLKAANEINGSFADRLKVTVFLRSDIYDNLFFDDQDKLRQWEETLFWQADDLKAVVCERVRVSLGLGPQPSTNVIWSQLFSPRAYRSGAGADKYIIDRTFKRPRDMISFVRAALDTAIKNKHEVIEPEDVRVAEEDKYSHSKYKDLIIEYQKQVPYIKDLLDSFSGSLHKLSQDELIDRLTRFIAAAGVKSQPVQLLRFLFAAGVIGVKRQGRAGVRQRGGAHFAYYYDDPSINPLAYSDYYIHLSLRYFLNVSEKREKITR